MMYDFTLFYEMCNEKFASFDDFAEACEKLTASVLLIGIIWTQRFTILISVWTIAQISAKNL